MKKQLLILVMMLLPIATMANDVEIDGIYYHLITKAKIAEVIRNPNHYEGNIVIPESIVHEGASYTVTAIGDNAFLGCTGLTSIIIPDNVTVIGNNAFKGCAGLTAITIPNNVTSIGMGAFESSGLTFITIPDSVKIIDFDTFKSCKSLTSVILPNGLKTISSSAFFASGLISIVLPDSLTIINGSAFSYCTSLTSVTFGNNLQSVGVDAFATCPALTSVHISDLEAWCKIYFSSSRFSTAYHLFLNGNEIKDLIIPNSFKSIPEGVFYNCIGLTSVTIPEGVTSIGNGTFGGCTGLNSLVIPNSVTTIGSGAFYGCTNITSIALGNNIKDIGTRAFAECEKLETVYCYSETVPYTGLEVFMGSYIQYATLYVPAASIESYKSKVPWSEFGTFKTIEDGVAQISSKAVLIQSKGGILKVEGINDGTSVTIYSPDGKQAGSAVSHNGAALVGTNIQPGNTAIVKIGEKSVKYVVK